MWTGIGRIFALLVCGLGIGWLTGLSASPTIAAVVAGLLGLAAALSSALAGLHEAPQAGEDLPSGSNRRLARSAVPHLSPIPVAALVVGVAFGASIGVYARANDWLGVNPLAIAAKWSKLDSKKVEADLFSSLYPSAPQPEKLTLQKDQPADPPAKKPTVYPGGGWLYTVPRSECAALRAADGPGLRQELRYSRNDFVRKAATVEDVTTLRKIVDVLCSDAH